MNITDKIRQRILKFLKLDKLDYNPNSSRDTFIFNRDEVKEQQLKENKTWFYGDSNELLNFYTNQELYGNAKEPIYNRNKTNYFWGISTTEANIKRVHSGIPHAIVTTLVNAIGDPVVTMADKELNDKLQRIIDENDMTNIINQQQMPLTMVEGWGAYKINIDPAISNVPIIEYYDAENVEFVYKSKRLIGIIYKDYYKLKNKNYVLFETRRIVDNASTIEYELYEMDRNDKLTEVPLETIPELEGLEDMTIPNFKHILGVPSKFFYDPLNKNYGRSIYAGKIDLFDDLDQILSQDSQTVRVSTPVEYYPADLLETDRNGNTIMPTAYNRQFIKKPSVPDGDGTIDGQINTTQPELNFDKYSADAKSKLDYILTGVLSPATMGIDVAKKDNAEAQREKEKVTIMTRNNIIAEQTKILRKLYSLCLVLQEYMDTNNITVFDYDVTVKFNEFANPSFENELQVLGTAWANGELSTKRYVDLLWGDKLSDEEKIEEIAYLEENRKQDTLNLGDFENEGAIGSNLQEQEDYE